MNISSWKEESDVVSGHRPEENANAAGGKIVKQPVSLPPSSSSSQSRSQSQFSFQSSLLRSNDPRIVRVSRAFSGKDRHSKVCTIRGLRDRRVRLSVPTAIQLYDLQDRLGVDQPSKAVDWLLDVAKEEIDELPPLPIPPENFSLLNHHHYTPFLNLKPGLFPTSGPGQGLGLSQRGYKIDGNSELVERRNDEHEDEGLNEENENREGYGAVLGNNADYLLPRTMNHHQHDVVGSDGSYYNMEFHHSAFHQTDHHHHNQNLVQFPSATTHSLFPSSSSAAVDQIIDPKQIISHSFQIPAARSSQNVPSLSSLIRANNNGSQ